VGSQHLDIDPLSCDTGVRGTPIALPAAGSTASGQMTVGHHPQVLGHAYIDDSEVILAGPLEGEGI